MHANHLGHVVFYVADLERSLGFWRDLLGFTEVGRAFGGRAAALSSGRTHHELLLIEVGNAPAASPGPRRGLYHVGIQVGTSMDELRAARAELEAAGVPIDGASDHVVTKSLYVRDPDGVEVELYIDDPSIDWRRDPSLVLAPIRPLDMDAP